MSACFTILGHSGNCFFCLHAEHVEFAHSSRLDQTCKANEKQYWTVWMDERDRIGWDKGAVPLVLFYTKLG